MSPINTGSPLDPSDLMHDPRGIESEERHTAQYEAACKDYARKLRAKGVEEKILKQLGLEDY